jgi:hypothetical protein
MNTAQQRMKDWIVAHIGSPEKMTATDHKIIDFLIVGLPSFLGMIMMFLILSSLYLWGLKKYGFEKTIIVLLINMIISINSIGAAIKSLSE